MPRDKNGQELHVGDRVTVEYVVLSILESQFATIDLETAEPMPDGGVPGTLRVNARQVTLAPPEKHGTGCLLEPPPSKASTGSG